MRLYLTEKQAGVTIRWFCTPPPVGSLFQVTRQEWSADYSERSIYAWMFLPEPRRRRFLGVVACDGYRLLIREELR